MRMAVIMTDHQTSGYFWIISIMTENSMTMIENLF